MPNEMAETKDRVMVDIETLGTEKGCAILSIGAVRFTITGLEAEFHRSISLESCQEYGLTIDASTLDWWLDQDGEVKNILTGGSDLPRALNDFSIFYDHADEIWANSPSFDCELLEAAYGAVGQDAPWEYWSERDVRTVKNLPVDIEVNEQGNEHDALDDAKNQARTVIETLRAMENQ